MTEASCYTCVYAYLDMCQVMQGFTAGFPCRPACANHPDSLGRMRPVPAGGVCRNYRPKPAGPEGDVRRIPLGDGFYAYVDAADYEWLSRYNWRLHNGYAARREKNKTTYMHREIMQPPKGMMVDHINHSKLDNCRVNLRICTRQQNTHNNRKHMGSSSRFKGVGYSKERGKWFAKLWFEGQRVWLGYFDSEIEAARAYDYAAVQYFGPFANPNFPEEWPPQRRQEVHAKWQEEQAEQRTEDRRPRAAGRKKTKDNGERAVGKERKAKGGKNSPRAGARSAGPRGKERQRPGRPSLTVNSGPCRPCVSARERGRAAR